MRKRKTLVINGEHLTVSQIGPCMGLSATRGRQIVEQSDFPNESIRLATPTAIHRYWRVTDVYDYIVASGRQWVSPV